MAGERSVERMLRSILAAAAQTQRALDQRSSALLERIRTSEGAAFSLAGNRMIATAGARQQDAETLLPLWSLVGFRKYRLLEMRLDFAVAPGGDRRLHISLPDAQNGDARPACLRVLRKDAFEGEFELAGEVKGTLRQAPE